MSENETTAPVSTRARKIAREIDYDKGIVTFTIKSSGETLVCDVSQLPTEIFRKLVPLAVNHRVGDAAAGREDDAALESMKKVWEGLCAGNFTIRQPAAPAISKNDIKEKLSGLSGKEASAAKALLEKLGIAL